MAFEDINSVLVADIGNVHTRLLLIDLVEGQYRLISSSRARSTAEPPLSSVSLGLEHAARHMTELSGRQLINPEGKQLFIIPEVEGHGADEFLVTSSAGRPLRVALVGLTPEASLASGRRVLAGTYIAITETLSPDDTRSEEEQINGLLRGEPDLILIVGGTDDGAEDTVLELVARVEKALSLIERGSMPSVLYAGNQALKRRVRDALASITDVFFAKNVRPRLHDEQLFPAQIELALVYDDYRGKSPGGFAEVGRQSQVGVVPTTQGYISAIRYMAELPQPGIGPLCVDVGSANSVIVSGVNKTPFYSIRTDLGVGHSIVSALRTVTPEAVLRWLPVEMTAHTLWDYAYDKQLRPSTVPGTAEELLIEQALAREIVRLLVAESRPAWSLGESEVLPPFQPIIAAGAILTEAQHPGISAMILLDALQPAGITEMFLDPHNLISALGVVAYLKPLITVQALETGGLVNLGTAFSPWGRARYGQDAMYVQVRQPNGQVINRTVRGGEIWMAPVLPGVTVEVSVKLRRGLSINGKQRIRRRVMAGAAGIIFDARGRPLAMPRPRDRAARFARWQAAMLGREPGETSRPGVEEIPQEAADALLS
ncbi:MAG: glutamate mutase L [Anaerolineae bacterium]|nr:glutamate mutase L [Anaerolineae bacterium]